MPCSVCVSIVAYQRHRRLVFGSCSKGIRTSGIAIDLKGVTSEEQVELIAMSQNRMTKIASPEICQNFGSNFGVSLHWRNVKTGLNVRFVATPRTTSRIKRLNGSQALDNAISSETKMLSSPSHEAPTQDEKAAARRDINLESVSTCVVERPYSQAPH